jgi:hypothetical protein
MGWVGDGEDRCCFLRIYPVVTSVAKCLSRNGLARESISPQEAYVLHPSLAARPRVARHGNGSPSHPLDRST